LGIEPFSKLDGCLKMVFAVKATEMSYVSARQRGGISGGTYPG
jgi:hypothetical protein